MSPKGSETMARTKKLNVVVQFGDTGYVINDLGLGKAQRYELYNIKEKKSIKKSNHPLEFDKYMEKIWKEGK